MLKGILGFFAFLFFLAVLILMLTGSYILKKVRQFNKAVQDAQDKQAFNHRTETVKRAESASSTVLVNLPIPPSQSSIRRPPRLLLARLS